MIAGAADAANDITDNSARYLGILALSEISEFGTIDGVAFGGVAAAPDGYSAAIVARIVELLRAITN